MYRLIPGMKEKLKTEIVTADSSWLLIFFLFGIFFIQSSNCNMQFGQMLVAPDD